MTAASSVLGQLALTFGVLSVMSIGGANATLPEIHRQTVDVLHWMDDATFANLVAIGQAAPGPNVLIVSIIGWHIAGIAGLLVATFAVVLPSSLMAVAIGRAMDRYSTQSWIAVVRFALAPIAVGFMLASGYVMTRVTYEGVSSIAIVVCVVFAIYRTKVSPVWAIAAGALIGVIAHRMHVFGAP